MNDQSRRVPADRGLSGLGLIMQLFGSVFGAFTTMIGVSMVIEFAQVRSYDGGGGSEASSMMLWVLLLAGSGVVRSLMHRAAGADLIYGAQPFAGIRRYFVASLVNAAAWLALLAGKAHAPGAVIVPVLMLLVAWPLALMIIINMPGIREMSEKVPAGEDKG